MPRYEWSKLVPYVKKCDMCAERQAKGQLPACVEACPVQASISGTREEILEEAQRRILNDSKYVKHIYGSEEAGGTSVFFISDVPFEKLRLRRSAQAGAAVADRQCLGRRAYRDPGRWRSAFWFVLDHATQGSGRFGRSPREICKGRELAMTTNYRKTAKRFPKISFWRTIVALIFAAGIYSMYARFALGFKAGYEPY